MKKTFDSYTAKRLIENIQDSFEDLESFLSSKSFYEEKICKISDDLLAQEVIKALAQVPVEELANKKSKIRVKTLQDAGFSNLSEISLASERELERISGIGPEGAQIIKRVVADIVNDTRKSITFELSIDAKTKTKGELIKCLSIYINSLIYYEKIDDLISNKEKIDSEILHLSIATNGLKWAFANKDKKLRAIEAYNYLQNAYESVLFDEINEIRKSLKKISNKTNVEAWSEFENNSATFTSVLDSVNPGVLNNGDEIYGLPENLAREVQTTTLSNAGLKCTLRRYQEWGVKYILHQEKVLLGDEMGLGKTVQAIAAMVSLYNAGFRHFMVICPLSVMTNWCREIAKFSELKTYKIYGTELEAELNNWKNNGGVAVTTYESTAKIELEDFRYAMLTVDEAHFIKNPETQRSKNVVKISKSTDRILYMTGTALENKVEEMLKLIRDLKPDIAKSVEKIAHLSSAKQFREKIAPVYYRRKREDVLTELPSMVETKEWCDMSKQEESAYEQSVLSKNFAEARQVSWNTDLVHSSKANRLKELVEMAKEDNRKILVFSFFLNTIFKIKEFLGDCCLDPIYGAVSTQRRQEIIDEFDHSPAGSVLVAQIQSGGTGLNIQSASVVILCEPQFKPSTENQAISRAYRMGQVRNVLVYRLLCQNTVDEKVLEFIDKKQKDFDAFADTSVAGAKSLEIDNKSFGNIIEEEIERIKKKNEQTN